MKNYVTPNNRDPINDLQFRVHAEFPSQCTSKTPNINQSTSFGSTEDQPITIFVLERIDSNYPCEQIPTID